MLFPQSTIFEELPFTGSYPSLQTSSIKRANLELGFEDLKKSMYNLSIHVPKERRQSRKYNNFFDLDDVRKSLLVIVLMTSEAQRLFPMFDMIAVGGRGERRDVVRKWKSSQVREKEVHGKEYVVNPWVLSVHRGESVEYPRLLSVDKGNFVEHTWYNEDEKTEIKDVFAKYPMSFYEEAKKYGLLYGEYPQVPCEDEDEDKEMILSDEAKYDKMYDTIWSTKRVVYSTDFPESLKDKSWLDEECLIKDWINSGGVMNEAAIMEAFEKLEKEQEMVIYKYQLSKAGGETSLDSLSLNESSILVVIMQNIYPGHSFKPSTYVLELENNWGIYPKSVKQKVGFLFLCPFFRGDDGRGVPGRVIDWSD